MTGKILIVYSTKSGINEEAANSIADVLKKTYSMDVTVADLRNGQPDITSFQNIIVGGGVESSNVYNEAVDFLEKDFGGRNVAVYFCCEDEENPKAQSTESNSKKALAKNKSLTPIDVAAFGGCMLRQGRPVMDELNMNRVKDWAIELGKKFYELEPIPVV
jgi:menaquinone-dependent protoporphyrinogen IX oxidase